MRHDLLGVVRGSFYYKQELIVWIGTVHFSPIKAVGVALVLSGVVLLAR